MTNYLIELQKKRIDNIEQSLIYIYCILVLLTGLIMFIQLKD